MRDLHIICWATGHLLSCEDKGEKLSRVVLFLHDSWPASCMMMIHVDKQSAMHVFLHLLFLFGSSYLVSLLSISIQVLICLFLFFKIVMNLYFFYLRFFFSKRKGAASFAEWWVDRALPFWRGKMVIKQATKF